jgi:L-threonylcarbamoyladenylate synthase
MTGTGLETAAQWLRQGEVVAIPTETVYGLAGNALDPAAVARIFEVKNRPRFNPLIVHTHSLMAAADWLAPYPDTVLQLAAAFWPGPLTLLLPKSPLIPDLVTAGHDRVAIRIPAHPLTLSLLENLDFPLAAPSANPFGYISPTTAAHVADQLGDKIPYILDGGPCQVGVESTIIGLEPDGRWCLYRSGGLAAERIEAVTGPLYSIGNQHDSPSAPGMLSSHYAPRTPLHLRQDTPAVAPVPPAGTAVIGFDRYLPGYPTEHQYLLSPNGDLREAARHLFALLRTLDQAGYTSIWAFPVPDTGLGRAINDRLRRAGV